MENINAKGNLSLAESPNFTQNEKEQLPEYLTEISGNVLRSVLAYSIVFLIAFTGNVIAVFSLWKQYKFRKSRIFLLLLHLAIADLIVSCVIIPTEVSWRLTIQWKGGDLLCKLTQFFQAFGLYLSSLVLVCVSLDRFIAIIFPMSVIGVEAYRRIKAMLAIAWILAGLFSTPQLIYFKVEGHPEFPTFKQCITSHLLDSSQSATVYSIFSVAVMYFLPLFVIIFTYTTILIKLVLKSNQMSKCCFPWGRGGVSENASSNHIQDQDMRTVEVVVDGQQTDQTIRLRCSSNAEANMSRAKTRTLVMTIVIVCAFVVCWTPYAFMTLWYMVDWQSAQQVDYRVQDALFLMVVANSCINPLIYGGFTYRRKGATRMPQRSHY